MAVPTLRLPSKYPSLPEGMAKNQAGLAAGRRYMLKHYPVTNPGLNTTSTELNLIVIMRPCLTMTLIQFCTSASLINVVTSEKSWFVAGSIGQKVSSTVYGRTVDKDTGRKQIKCTWLILVN
jgi:hypothetical protein